MTDEATAEDSRNVKVRNKNGDGESVHAYIISSGEYPAGSVGCAEASGELKEGHRNRWFIMFTNVQIDIGFILGSLVAMIVTYIAPHHLHAVWRICLGLGIIPPLSLLYLRLKLKEPEAYSRESFKKKTPYWLAFKFYGPRLIVVCAIWFIYDFLTYPFSIYSSAWISAIQPHASLWQSFGWSTLVNFFYLPGALVRPPAGSGPHQDSLTESRSALGPVTRWARVWR